MTRNCFNVLRKVASGPDGMMDDMDFSKPAVVSSLSWPATAKSLAAGAGARVGGAQPITKFAPKPLGTADLDRTIDNVAAPAPARDYLRQRRSTLRSTNSQPMPRLTPEQRKQFEAAYRQLL